MQKRKGKTNQMKREFITTIWMAFIILTLSACGKETAVEEAAVEETAAENAGTLPETDLPDVPEKEDTEESEEIEAVEETTTDTEEAADEIPDSTIMEFKDSYLQKLAEKNAGSFMIKDLRKISELEIDMDKVTYPEELAYFIGLEKLRVESDNQSDLSWLADCSALRYIDLDYNYLEDISPLQESSIEVLVIETYGLKDLADLENMETLRAINVNSDVLTDVSALGNLPNLSVIAINSPSITSINLDLSQLKNMVYFNFQGENLTDVSCLNSLQIPENITFFMQGEIFETLDFLEIPFVTVDRQNEVSRYRNVYDNDKRSDKEQFKSIVLQTSSLTEESIKAIAKVNYEYLSAVKFHLDAAYEFVTLNSFTEEEAAQYRAYMDTLIAEKGDPMQIEAVTIKGQSRAPESWENAEVYYDGQLIGLDHSLEEMLRKGRYTIGRYNNPVNLSYHLGAGETEDFTVYKTEACEKKMFWVRLYNPSETESNPLSSCEIVKLTIDRNTSADLNLPQGKEEYRIVGWDYFTPLSFGEYQGNFAAQMDRSLEKCTMIYMTQNGCQIELETTSAGEGSVSCYINYYQMGDIRGYEEGERSIPISKIETITISRDY